MKDAIAPHGGKVRVFFMDQAGWHKSKQLKLPSNIIPARRDDSVGQLQCFALMPPCPIHDQHDVLVGFALGVKDSQN